MPLETFSSFVLREPKLGRRFAFPSRFVGHCRDIDVDAPLFHVPCDPVLRQRESIVGINVARCICVCGRMPSPRVGCERLRKGVINVFDGRERFIVLVAPIRI